MLFGDHVICDAFGDVLLVPSFLILSQLFIGRAERNVIGLCCCKKIEGFIQVFVRI
jgi:hypothetical protein